MGGVVDGSRDMSVLVGDRTVHIKQGHLFGGDRRFQVGQADVGIGCRKGIDGEQGDGE